MICCFVVLLEFGIFITISNYRTLNNRSVNRLINDESEGHGKAQVLDHPKELSHLLYVASRGELGVRNVAIIWMLFGSALRVNEVAQLKVKDLLHTDGSLVDYFVLPGAYTKTNKPRRVFVLVKEQRKSLMNWVELRQQTNGLLHNDDSYGKLNPNSRFFLSKKGTWRQFAFNAKKYKTGQGIKETMVCSSMENLVRGIVKSAGFSGGSSHSGRRTLATWFYRKGIRKDVIQGILGHSSEEMTDMYIEPDKELVRSVFKYLWSDLKI